MTGELPTRDQIDVAIDQGKREILADIQAGTVPKTVKTFSELHDYVDANYYGGLFEVPFFDDARGDDDHIAIDAANEVQDGLNFWLEGGRKD